MKKSDPFEVAPLAKAFYYPSREKELSKKEKKVCLSAPYNLKYSQDQVSSPEDLKFLRETKRLKAQEVPTRENGSTADLSSTSQFNESWPSTERSRSVSTPLTDGAVSSPEMSEQMREWLEGQEKIETNTTLGWYINRFRNAPPTDRQRRDKTSFSTKTKVNFWWLSPPSEFSTPSGQSTPVPGSTPPQRLPPSPKKSPSPSTNKGTKYTSSMSSHLSGDMDERTTADLERRTKELLEKSETSMETISTEPFPLPLKKAGESKPSQVQAGLDSYKTSFEKTKLPTAARSLSTKHPNPWPEDDILYQWRLARKMEKAQEKVKKTDIRLPVKQTNASGIKNWKPSDIPTTISRNIIHELPTGPSILDSSTLPGSSGMSIFPEQTASDLTPIMLSQTSAQTSVTTSVATVSATSCNMVNTRRGPCASVSMVTSCAEPIATPLVSKPCRHLRTKSSGGEEEIRPHMHLACDILPCNCTGDAIIPYHHHNQHQEVNKTDEGRLTTEVISSDVKGYATHETDEEKENEVTGERESSCKPSVSKKLNKSKKQCYLEKKIKTSSSMESLSSGTESEIETRRARRKEKQPKMDKNEKSKEIGTSNMVQNVIGEVISEHMFSGRPSTSNNDQEKTTKEKCGNDGKKQQQTTLTLDQEILEGESSEEEYPDDEILKLFRQRSRNLKNELRRIESLLEQEL